MVSNSRLGIAAKRLSFSKWTNIIFPVAKRGGGYPAASLESYQLKRKIFTGIKL